jgi:predicted PurR-regulated permease PerM
VTPVAPKTPPLRGRSAAPSSLPARDSELPQLLDRPVAPKIVQRRKTALGLLLLLSFLAVARLAAPVWIGIVFGALMAFTVQPFYRRLSVRLGERRVLSAVLTTIATGVLFAVAGSVALYVTTRELFGIIAFMQAKLDSGSIQGVVGEQGAKLIHRLGFSEADLLRRIQLEVGRAQNYATEAAGLVLQTVATAVLSLIIGCITMYYVLIEWPAIPLKLERVLPLAPKHTRALVLEFRDVGRTVMVGTMATAFAQGLLATIGYMVTDLSHAVAWGLLTSVASFFPAVGTALVWGPVSLYYLAKGQVAFAVLQVAWGLVIVVGLGDYILRPRLVGRQGKGQTLLTLVAALGGMEVFGLAGLFVGPVLMSLFLAILRIYEREAESSERADDETLFAASDDSEDGSP